MGVPPVPKGVECDIDHDHHQQGKANEKQPVQPSSPALFLRSNRNFVSFPGRGKLSLLRSAGPLYNGSRAVVYVNLIVSLPEDHAIMRRNTIIAPGYGGHKGTRFAGVPFLWLPCVSHCPG